MSHIKPCCKTLHHHRLHHHQQHQQQFDQAWVACSRCCFSPSSTYCLVMLSCLNGRFCVLSMTRIQTTFNMHIYTSSVLTFVSRVVLQPLCPDHRLLCVPLQASLQDTAAAPPPPPTSRSTSPGKIGSRVPAVLLSSKVYQLLT